MQTLISTIIAYHQSDHTASVQPLGTPTTLRVPVAYHIPWWQAVQGKYALVIMPDDTNPNLACLIAVYGAGLAPLDPHFDPSYGHRHRGIEDDAPTLP